MRIDSSSGFKSIFYTDKVRFTGDADETDFGRQLFDYAESEGFLRNPYSLPTASCAKGDSGFLLESIQTGKPLFLLRKVRDSNPRYDVMRTPHFECGSFDHSDNFPNCFGEIKIILRFCQKRRKSTANFANGKKKRIFYFAIQENRRTFAVANGA